MGLGSNIIIVYIPSYTRQEVDNYMTIPLFPLSGSSVKLGPDFFCFEQKDGC